MKLFSARKFINILGWRSQNISQPSSRKHRRQAMTIEMAAAAKAKASSSKNYLPETLNISIEACVINWNACEPGECREVQVLWTIRKSSKIARSSGNRFILAVSWPTTLRTLWALVHRPGLCFDGFLFKKGWFAKKWVSLFVCPNGYYNIL